MLALLDPFDGEATAGAVAAVISDTASISRPREQPPAGMSRSIVGVAPKTAHHKR